MNNNADPNDVPDGRDVRDVRDVHDDVRDEPDVRAEREHIDLWLVDGFNVLHACLLKGRDRQAWWRAEAQARVARWLDGFAQHDPVTLVFDAARPDSERCANAGFNATLHFAPDADAAIVQAVRSAPAPQRICVVTADRSLTDRCKALRARTLRPWAFEEVLTSEQYRDAVLQYVKG